VKLSGIGDSIMQGYDAGGCGLPFCGEQPEYSFGQGTQPAVNSVYSRYRALGLLSGGEEFVSASGSEMVSDAQAQAQAVCALAQRPDRIVLLLGGNDVCNRASFADLYPPSTFRAALKAALVTLGAPACGLPAGSWVHVLSMSRVDRLRAAGLAKDALYCEAVWSAVGICPIVTQETQSSVLDQIGAAIDAYNTGIAIEVAAADLAHGGPAGVRFTTDWVGTTPGTSVGTYSFGAADVSDIDCFHPSIEGQRRLACIAWETWEFGSRNVGACVQ
jgi:lysophospholipase L1-like esterase